MPQKPILMIHEIREWMFELPLEDYILTFDDGLYSQYYYWPKIKKIPTEKIFFISSGIVSQEKQSREFPICNIAHQKAFNGIFEDYMTLDQIKELDRDPLVTIGGHGHNHRRLNTFTGLLAKVEYIKQDTQQMLDWFVSNLGFKPTKFCFPYNDDLDGLYPGLLKKYGICDFYGRDRLKIEDFETVHS